MVMNAGALQPLSVRQLTTPLPCSPPTMNPALVNVGTTAMQVAACSTDDGIGLAPVVMLCTVWVAASKTLVLSTAHSAKAHNGTSTSIEKTFLIDLLLIVNRDLQFASWTGRRHSYGFPVWSPHVRVLLYSRLCGHVRSVHNCSVSGIATAWRKVSYAARRPLGGVTSATK